MLFDTHRETVAYAILAAIAIVAIPTVWIVLRRRRRERLRRRGIKTYRH